MDPIRDGAGLGGAVRALLAAVWFLPSGVQAADPWGRPGHLRVVQEPPRSWSDLDAPRARHRLFWDAGEGLATIWVEHHGAWRVLATQAEPGWTSRPLPVESRFRVVLEGAQRTSPVVAAPAWRSPAELAQLGATRPSVGARTVGDLSLDAQTGRLLVATLGGGAVSLDSAGRLDQAWTRWEGLPSDRVVAVALEGGRGLVGTAQGLAVLEDGRVRRVLDDALPDPYVQAVGWVGGRAWVGTYRGLARLDPGGPTTVLPDASVFSITPAVRGGLWVGYRGLQWVAEDAPPWPANEAAPGSPYLPGDDVYDVLDTGAGGLLAASLEQGVRALLPTSAGGGERVPVGPLEGTTGLARTEAGLWVAAGSGGLFGPDGDPVGPGDGLDVHAAWSAAAQPGGVLHVGTDQGLWTLWSTFATADAPAPERRVRDVLHHPLSAWPADTASQALWRGPEGVVLGGREGVRVVGAPWPEAGDLVVAAPPRVVAITEAEGVLWAVGQDALSLDRRGRLQRVRLPERATDAAAAADGLWWTGDAGLWRVPPEEGRAVLVAPLPDATRVAPGVRGVWVLSRGVVFRVVGGVSRPYLRVGAALDLAPAGDAVWVGTEEGLERLWLSGEDPGRVDDVLGDRDRGVEVPAVAATQDGGCWFAAADGTVGRVSAAGDAAAISLPEPDPARPLRIVPDGDQHAWVLTEQGTWRVRLAPPGQ